MSKEAAAEIEKIRQEMFEAQRVCSWCDKECKSADHLYIHIVLRHPNGKD